MFMAELPFIASEDLPLIMGESIRAWWGWSHD
jgi:hypothetical protein